MSNDNDVSPRDVTEVRFSIRAMLIAMAVLAVVITALGAFIRHFPPEARWRLTVYWSVLAAVMLAMFLYTARKRYAAEAKAGRVLYRLMPHSYFFPRAPTFSAVIAGVVCLAFAPAIWIVHSFMLAEPRKGGWALLFDANMFYGFIAAAAGFSYFWWRRIVLAENGLIVRNEFIPWAKCRRWYWDACYKNVAVIATPTQSMMAVKVPAEEREAIAALLSEKCVTVNGSTDVDRAVSKKNKVGNA